MLLAQPTLAAENPLVAEVIKAEKARGAALMGAETQALTSILAADFKYTHSSGTLESKETQIKSFVAGHWIDYHLLFQAVWRKNAHGWELVNLQPAAPPQS